MSVGEWWWGGAESFIKSQLKSHLFPVGILAEAINMTHSDILYRLDTSMFSFYEPLLFPLTIFINIFICFKFYLA